MAKITRFRVKPGSVMPKNAREGGSWIKPGATHFISKIVSWPDGSGSFSINIAFCNGLDGWNDFDNVLVLDDDFGQPYTPFYHTEYKLCNAFPCLQYVIDTYNNYMKSMPFLEAVKTDNKGEGVK